MCLLTKRTNRVNYAKPNKQATMQERRNETIQYMAGISKESVRIYPPLSFKN
jgi:hypothetical protein